MTAFAITGGQGFLGWHLRCRLRATMPGAEVRVLGRGDLDDAGRLADRLNGCDAVFHLAAVNSHEAAAAAQNPELAERLADGLAKLADPPHVVYSNSSHVERDTPYGRSKAAAAIVLERWAAAGGTVADVVLPNLFGEGGRPRYNSAVATFCEAVVSGRPCDIDPNGRTELLHAQDAASVLLQVVSKAGPSRRRIPGEAVAIPDVYDRLARWHEEYRGTHTVPALLGRMDVRLFNQLRMAMFPDAYPVDLVRHADVRGAFFEAARGSGDTQTSFSTTAPGVTRGEHWHIDKIERFLVLRGTATIEIRRLFDDAVHTFSVSGERPAFVDMPTLHPHNITNVGDDELLTMFWANDHFDPADADSYPEPVRAREAASA